MPKYISKVVIGHYTYSISYIHRYIIDIERGISFSFNLNQENDVRSSTPLLVALSNIPDREMNFEPDGFEPFNGVADADCHPTAPFLFDPDFAIRPSSGIRNEMEAEVKWFLFI
jgi:hypothetical protein